MNIPAMSAGLRPQPPVVQAKAFLAPVRFGAQSPLDIVTAQQRLYSDVHVLTQWFRNPQHMDQLNLAASYIHAQFKQIPNFEKLGLRTEEQVFFEKGRRFRNIILSMGPKDAERFVVGAHYDVFQDQPGADDNASGVAGMLEVARSLAPKAKKLKKRVDFVAYTLEEQPYATLGSLRHVEKLKAEGAKVAGMVSLEMIGYFSETKGSQSFPSKILKWLYPSTGNFIAAVGFGPAWRLMFPIWKAFKGNPNLPFRSLYSPVNAFGLDRSDHRYFAESGIPALMITDTANHRNKNYHRPGDTIYTLNFDKMAEVVKGTTRLVQALTT